MTPAALSGGFSDTSVQAARAFRAALDAMARPGKVVALAGATPPAPLSVAAGVLVLTLVDTTTPLYLAPSHDTKAVRDWITFHTGAPFVEPAAASFALGNWSSLLPLDRFSIGSAEYPDRAATLIVELASLAAPTARISGPGIAVQAGLALPEVAAFAENHALYPLGLDFFFTADDRLAALPRSTRVEAA